MNSNVDQLERENTQENEHHDIKSYETWDELHLDERLLKGIFDVGFKTPSPIQKKAIKPIIEGKDIRAQAQSGTGKTGAFAVGALQKINTDINAVQVLIVVSTREIALQNADIMQKLGSHMGVKVCCLVGGGSVNEDKRILSENPHAVTGTPGRIIHMMKDNFMDTSQIKLFILDEADEMLKMGFVGQVKEIYTSIKSKIVQTAMFSATWTPDEIKMTRNILKNPVIIDLRQEEQTLKGIEQYYVDLGPRPATPYDQDEFKLYFLLEIFANNNVGQCVIFVNSKLKAKKLHEKLNEKQIPCDIISSALTHTERTSILDHFKAGKSRTLIATGLLGRGIDVRQLSLVFNYEIPAADDKSSYIHRIGRAGRYGRKGKAINIIFSDEHDLIKDIEQYYSTKINPLPNNLEYS